MVETIKDANPLYDQPALSDAQLCKAKGGVWDELTQICTMPKVPEESPPGIFDIQGTAKQGITLPDGTTLTGLNKDNIRDVVRQQTGGIGQPETIGLQSVALAEQQKRATIMDAIANIGKVGKLTEAQQASIDKSQAFTAGVVGEAPSILATAGGFAAGGAVIGGPVVALAGAGLGLIAGVARGLLGNIKEQQRGELQAADIELTNSRTAMRQLAMLASQDPANADVYIKLYNAQLTRTYQAKRQTEAEVAGDLNSFMEDGREQIADFDAFLEPGKLADIYGLKLQIALESNIPLTENDFLLDEALL